MKLFYSRGACSLAVRIVANEINIPCEYEAVDLKTKLTQSGSNFLAINPKGAVPTLITDEGQVLTENAVIQQYLADVNKATQVLPGLGDFKRYQVLEWLNFVTTELHKGFGPLFTPDYPKEAIEKFTLPKLTDRFSFVDKQLVGKTFLMGDTFTLPDAYLFVMLLWASSMKINIQSMEHLTRYYHELLQRDSIKRSLEEEGIKR